MPNHLIKTDRELAKVVPSLIGLDFAFDTETTGLNIAHDELLGISLSIEGNNYYFVHKHTVESAQIIEVPYVEEEVIGYEEEEYFTPKKKLRRTRQVPVTKEVKKVRTETRKVYSTEEFISRDSLVRYLSPIFAQPHVVMVAHNMKYDLHFLDRIGIPVGGLMADTMLAAKICDENRQVGLKRLAHLVDMQLDEYKELDHYEGFDKDAFLAVPLDQAAKYAMEDSEATYKLWFHFSKAMTLEDVDQAFSDLWMPLMLTLQEMESKGIAVDLEQVRLLKNKYSKIFEENTVKILRVANKMLMERYGEQDIPFEDIPKGYQVILRPDIHDEIVEYIKDDPLKVIHNKKIYVRGSEKSRFRALQFNASSNTQLGELFYDHLGLKKPEGVLIQDTQNGKPVDKKIMRIWELSLGEDCPEEVKWVIARREAEKFITTYLTRLEEDADESDNFCIRTSFNQHIADTGRLTSSGPNLQNIPSRGVRGKEARALYVARPDHKLICADYSMMELRIAAHYAARYEDNHTMMQAFTDGLDLHALTASQQFNIEYEELLRLVAEEDTDAKLKRAIGKTSNFGLLYGMGPRKFQTYLWTEVGIYLSLHEVKELIEQFNQTFSAVMDWERAVIDAAHRSGYVRTMAGRKRRLPDLYSMEKYVVLRAERQGVNAVVQGSCADIIGKVMPHIQTALRPLGGYLLLQVHDELVAEVPEIFAETAKNILEEFMVQFVNYKLRVPLVAEAHIGDSWADAKG